MADSQSQIPKLEDFLGDSSFVRYSDNLTESQDSPSLTQLYDPRHHTGAEVAGFFSDYQHHDLKKVACFQTNSGSEIVDDSASVGRRAHLSNGSEFLGGHSKESSTTAELGFNGGSTEGGALSLAVNDTDRNLSCDNGGEKSKKTMVSKKVTTVESSEGSKKKIAETFGQRTSIYRGVTR